MKRTPSKFHTLVEIPKFQSQFSYNDKLLFIGSCFTENIGRKLEDLLFDVQVNPFGILYNPFSVANCLQRLMDNQPFEEDELIYNNGLYHSFSHHGDFSNIDKLECIININKNLSESASFLQHTQFLFITFGTSWIYQYKNNEQIVANCHKVPANEFARKKLSVDEIVETYNQLIDKLKHINSNLQIIFTVSPIRHLKDGAIENQRSKSTLILSIEKILQNHANCHYFPSYELVMDELRDYRFYSSDMTHLNETAINHIWELFCQSLIDEKSVEIGKKIKKLLLAKNHRPINKNSQSHRLFLEKCLQQVKDIQSNHPEINVTSIQSYFLAQL